MELVEGGVAEDVAEEIAAGGGGVVAEGRGAVEIEGVAVAVAAVTEEREETGTTAKMIVEKESIQCIRRLSRLALHLRPRPSLADRPPTTSQKSRKSRKRNSTSRTSPPRTEPL
jgi:hypothetical protein